MPYEVLQLKENHPKLLLKIPEGGVLPQENFGIFDALRCHLKHIETNGKSFQVTPKDPLRGVWGSSPRKMLGYLMGLDI